MKAAYDTGSGWFEAKDTATMQPGPGEVRVKVVYCGIYGADAHFSW